MKRIKRIVGIPAIWVILSPIMPGLLLAMAFESAAKFIDWVHASRWLTVKLVEVSERIERWSFQ